MRRSRTLTVALGGMALVATVAGCKVPGMADDAKGASDPASSTSATQLVSDATKKSQTVSTARFTMHMSVKAAGSSITTYSVGQMDTAKKAITMTSKTRMPGIGSFISRERVVDGAVYTSGSIGGLKTHKGWVKQPAASADELSKNQSNPADQLAVFQALGDGVKPVGPVTVHGVATTKYAGSLNLAKPASASEPQAVKEARKDMGDIGLTSVPFTFYIDKQGLPARMALSMNGDDKDAGKIKTVILMDFADWGKPVSIVAPTVTS